jgi:hypothetical protein
VLKYVGSDKLQDRLPGIIRLFVQIIDEPRGLECLKAVLVYFTNATDKISHEQLTVTVERAFRDVKLVLRKTPPCEFCLRPSIAWSD